MDAIDILGSVLGHKTNRSGRGTDILNEILKRGAGRRSPSPTVRESASPSRNAIEREARELEDLLNVAGDRPNQPRAAPSRTTTHRQADSTRRDARVPDRQASPPSGPTAAENERALLLVRAMIQAAMSDGRIDRSEQQNIIGRLGNPSREAIELLNEEFAKSSDVRDFAWSVPVGMEQQVYTMSLIAIDLDTQREAKYLRELAQGLRIPADVRDAIHRRLGAPTLS